MKLFEVKKGTEVRAIRDGREWYPGNFEVRVTKKDHVFDLEEIRVDPVGQVGSHKGHRKTLGGAYAESGYYGFGRAGWVLLVPMRFVKVL